MSFRFGSRRKDEIYGTRQADLIHGRGNDDVLKGGGGPDIVRGGRGDDQLIFELAENSHHRWFWDFYNGGRGNDTLVLELTATEWSDPDLYAEVIAYLDYLDDGGSRRGFWFETLHLRVKNIEHLEIRVDGSLIDDPRGDAPVVIDDPDATEDLTITTGSGDDAVTTGSGNDTIDTGDGNDVIDSGGGNDIITIGDGDDVVHAGPGNDTIIAGQAGGNDFIEGGPGNDTVKYPSLEETEPVTIDLTLQDRSDNATAVTLLTTNGLAADTPVGLADGGFWVDTDVLVSIENAIGGKGNDNITGNDQLNLLSGLEGNDTIRGGDGDDRIEGGEGHDSLFGDGGEDFITPGAGDDTVDGGTGYDTIVLTGDSTDYVIQSIGGGSYTANGPDGTNTFKQVEQLTFDDGTFGLWNFVSYIEVVLDNSDNTYDGTAARERVFALDGNDTLSGGQEEDSFIGGRGNDVLDGGGINDPDNLDDQNFLWDNVFYDKEYDNAVNEGARPNGVTVNLATGITTDVYGDTDTLIEIERVWGTRVDDSFTGSSEDEAFDPNGGNDFVDGGGGRDALHYHLVDGYYGVGTTSGIEIQFSAAVAGSGTVIDPLGDTDTFVGIEVVRGTRYDDVFNGGAGDQEFRGYDGADFFDGGAGFDLVNYSGDANYDGFFGITADLVAGTIVDAFGSTDTVVGIEGIRGTGVDDSIAGDMASNSFRGHGGDDLLSGAGGNDQLEGGRGNDTLEGGADDDILFGQDDNDILIGGTGNDYMEGGFGDDEFRFSAGDGDDIIGDFEVGVDSLSIGALMITSTADLDINGDGDLDTLVTLSSGDTVGLLFVTDITDSSLLTA